MLMRILDCFLNKIIHIIIDNYYNKNPTGSEVISYYTKVINIYLNSFVFKNIHEIMIVFFLRTQLYL